MKKKFKVDVIIHIRESVEVEVNTDHHGMFYERKSRDEAASQAYEKVRSWDWHQDQLGHVDGISIEVMTPVEV